ncbi:MAG TPA: orotate phosphoribosyltransferase [Elusimicrobiales bacterium]|nr:orotate phosphoribosyltransferase [Elusimicrobiales bacterium]
MTKLNNLDIMGLLQEHGAILNGHFQLPCGYHSQMYIQTSLVMQYPHIAHKIAKAMSDKFKSSVDVVLAPGGATVVVGQELARVKKARSIFVENVEGKMILKRNFVLKPGEKVLIADDVVTRGGRVKKAIALAKRYGAKVVGVCAIIDRSDDTLSLNVPIRALLSYPLTIYPPNKCPLCKSKLPITVPGSPLKAKK